MKFIGNNGNISLDFKLIHSSEFKWFFNLLMCQLTRNEWNWKPWNI